MSTIKNERTTFYEKRLYVIYSFEKRYIAQLLWVVRVRTRQHFYLLGEKYITAVIAQHPSPSRIQNSVGQLPPSPLGP